MMRGGVPWLLHEFPDVVDQKIVKSADLFLETSSVFITGRKSQ